MTTIPNPDFDADWTEAERRWSAVISGLIDALGDDHDEEECDDLGDLIDEARAVIERLRRNCRLAVEILDSGRRA